MKALSKRRLMCGCGSATILGLLSACGGGDKDSSPTSAATPAPAPGSALPSSPGTPSEPVASIGAGSGHGLPPEYTSEVNISNNGGCALTSANAADGSIMCTSYPAIRNADLHRLMTFLHQRMSNFFRIRSSFSYADECGNTGNATASRNGHVVFGIKLLDQMISTFPSHYSWPIAYILGHENAHIFQFTNRFYNQAGLPTVVIPELVADAMSFFYLSMNHSNELGNSQEAIFSVLHQAFSIGDTNFNDPTHHGTPGQRATALAVGAQIALAVAQRRVPYEWDAIHKRIFESIVLIQRDPQYRYDMSHAEARERVRNSLVL